MTTPPAATVAVRPMTDDDLLVPLNEGNPLGWMAEYWTTLTDSLELSWFVGLLDDRPAGFGVVCPLPIAAGGYAVGMINVRPEHRRRGVATALHAALAEIAGVERPGIMYQHVAGDAVAEAAARARGLPAVGTHHESVLDLRTVDREAYAALADVPGVRMATVDPFALDEDGWHALHLFTRARFQDAPDAADGGGDLPLGAFRSMLTDDWLMATAREGSELVGIALVAPRPGHDGAVNTVITGVAPEARGRGIATALKAWHALAMADRGCTRVYTQNMEGNEPILAANRRLGFVRDIGYVDVACAFG